MIDPMPSKLQDSDMQGSYKALLRAALRAREVARQTNTPLVLMRDGVLVEEDVNSAAAIEHEQRLKALVQPDV